MFDGKGGGGKMAGKKMSGGNKQREAFGGGSGSSSGSGSGGGKDKTDTKINAPKGAGEGQGDEATTQITHHADGSHTAVHSDGETSEHPSFGHLAMHMHSKHAGGEGMHAHKHESGVTTHHAGMDGMVEGPHEHGSVDEAAEHMKSMMGEDGGNGSMEMSDGESDAGMPTLY